MRALVAIPVYNEQKYLRKVLERVLVHSSDVLVVDDGSSDATPRLLLDYPVDMVRHARNSGYGRSMRSAFRWAVAERYDWLVTMDCDEQHEPEMIPAFLERASQTASDVISGSRYTSPIITGDRPPPDRRAINALITDEINARLGSSLGADLTDAFCGFKAYRVDALRALRPTIDGYAFPMQFWAQAAAAGLKVEELPVKLIYNDTGRTFGVRLDDPDVRLAHYRCVLHREIRRLARLLPAGASAGLSPCDDDAYPSIDHDAMTR